MPRIVAQSDSLQSLPDSDLRQQCLSLRYRARSGESLDLLLVDVYALVREVARRTLQLRLHDVQVLGAIAMHYRCIAEMEAGEGKTLTATLPMCLASLAGKGALLATANDYLAKRDADWMGKIYALLGLKVGVIQAQQPEAQRRAAYECDVTYGTAKEFGFDFLRDQLDLHPYPGASGDGLPAAIPAAEQPIQRGLYFCLVDEADSLLIDEARTPLLIGVAPGTPSETKCSAFAWAAQIAPQCREDLHYKYDRKKRTATLYASGRELISRLPPPPLASRLKLNELCTYVERAIQVARDFHLDRQYVVRDGEVVIVDEFTGRPGEGRKWRDGVHQAVEAKEGVRITDPTGLGAQITVQELFAQFERLAGMTGTAFTSSGELHKVYGLRVVPIPTNRQVIRIRLPEAVFDTAEEKWSAIVREVSALAKQGRPVLIGTRSIDKSELLSKRLRAEGIEHQLLNARHLEIEAKIVAAAGQRDKVTVATNLAGRGTDILLGEGVAELGGLHVICSEMHESARIDKQLIGRCGRQGDPGSFRIYISLEDDLVREAWGKDAQRRLAGGVSRLGTGKVVKVYRKAQRAVERRHFRQRKLLVLHTKERSKMLRQMGLNPFLHTVE